MSHLLEPELGKAPLGAGEPGSLDAVSNRFRSALNLETDKPDSKNLLDLYSPIKPFPARPSANAATPTSSSSSSNGSVSARQSEVKNPGLGLAERRSRSGEFLLGPKESLPGAVDIKNSKPGHRRSGSVPLIYSGGSWASGSTTSSGSGISTASSPATNVLPAGNICPSGKIGKTGMTSRSTPRSDVLGSGTGNYGHGNILRGGSGTIAASAGKAPPEVPMGNGVDSAVRKAMVSVDPEEVKRVGNELYKKGQFAEALRVYDRAIALCPDNAVCRSNRAAALTGLRRLGEAVKECEEALRLDPSFNRAHQRLASLYMRLGQIENARKHVLSASQSDTAELQKLQSMEKHLIRCSDARKIGDWKIALREIDAVIAEGADSSPLLGAAKAEALLRLRQLDDAELALTSASKPESLSYSSSDTRFFGMLSDSYFYHVRALVEMTRGRFENAIAASEKAKQIDAGNIETTMLLNNVRAVARARSLGNELFNSGKFMEACLAYGDGLKYDPSNPVLYCNRAACRSKLGQWEKSIEDCNEALRIQPNYKKALLRRAASYCKLERWSEAVRDYEILRKELPTDTEVAEAHFHAQIALKTSRGEEVSNLKFGGEVEVIKEVEQYHAAITLPGVCVIHFMAARNQNCTKITPFVDSLCTKYPSVNFLKVDVNEIPDVAKAENVRTIPTFKIYKNGTKVKEMICPSQQVLEYSVRHYGF